MDEARAKNLCTNCLRPGHFASACNSRKCLKCFRHHHTLLHLEEPHTKPLSENVEVPSSSTAAVSAHHAYSTVTSPAQVLLSTCIVQVRDVRGKYHEARILLDSGSQVNFICESLANRLAVAQTNINMPIKGISQPQTCKNS